jgi:hypothetical protein
VLVENFENPDLYAAPSERISRGIADSLTEKKVATFIDLTKINDLRTSDPKDYHKMDVPAIGRAVGAKQVIYVNLVKLNADSPIGGERFRGQAEVQVKVIDSETGHTLWPLDSSGGRVVRFDTKYAANQDDTQFALIQDQLCQNLTNRISALFHETAFDEVQANASN